MSLHLTILHGCHSALVIGVLVETDIEASKTRCLKALQNLDICLD